LQITGKGENIWDFWSHENNGTNIQKGHNGDTACDSYHKYQDDVKILKDMGVGKAIIIINRSFHTRSFFK